MLCKYGKNLIRQNLLFVKNFLVISNNFLKFSRTSSICSLSSKLINEEKQRAVRRSLLYVPGHDRKKVDKLSHLKVDCAVLDCEDGVAFDRKELARITITEMCEEVALSCQGNIAVRVNSPQSPFIHDDIVTIFGSNFVPSTIVIPKINCAEDLQWSCDLLQKTLSMRSRVEIIFMVESAKGLINMKNIVESGIAACARPNSRCRIDGVIFGSDDYCADLGISRSPSASELMFARQSIVATAKAFGLQAIDMVYIDYKDPAGLQAQAVEGFQMGFTGKQVIHPDQINAVQTAFSPSAERIEWARELIDAYQANPRGVFTFRGQMIDLPTLLQAQNIIRTTTFNKK